MQQQEELDFSEKLKRNFNIGHFLFLIHQRAIVVVCRDNWGTQALGFPCLCAFMLMMLWYVFTHDNLMLAWIGFWLLCLAKRRMESVRLAKSGAVIHSRYDGWPINLGSNENRAKLIYEPVLVGILGFMAFKFYQHMGWRPTGLPYFLLLGVATLPFVEMVKQKAWERRTQSMMDARLEQQEAINDFRDKYGDF